MPTTYDVVGIGIGPFNLSLAALADGVQGLSARFFEARTEWSWHPGLLFDDARLQVPFLADLVTLVDPTSRWSFLSYLSEHERLFPFYFSERFHVPRREYDHYCQWVSRHLGSCRFGEQVTAVEWNEGNFVVTTTGETVRARNVVLGIGSEPVVPPCFTGLLGERVFSASEYLQKKENLAVLRDVSVVGSGQTGAEVFLDLARDLRHTRRRLRWYTRSPAFAPMEYSKLGLEHFTPEYTTYFHGLPPRTRERLLPAQWQLYKAISADTIAEIHDLLYELSVGGTWPNVVLTPNTEVTAVRPAPAAHSDGASAAAYELVCRNVEQDKAFTARTEAVILATGYQPRQPAMLDPIKHLIRRDETGRFQIGRDYRVDLAVPGGLYVQNAESHSHGVGAPDLGLGAHRAATILNSITGRTTYRLPSRTAFTTFGAPGHDAAGTPIESHEPLPGRGNL